MLVLLANGNFWRPKGFGLNRRGPDDAGWVALALLGWAALAAPGIIEIHRAFQSVEP